MRRKFSAFAVALAAGLSSLLIAPTPAHAARSQCTSTWYSCTWENTNYGGTWLAYGRIYPNENCLSAGNYGFRSVYNRDRDGGVMYVFSNSNCTGTSRRFDSGTYSGSIGFTAKSYQFVFFG
jgi:hypothetical protein